MKPSETLYRVVSTILGAPAEDVILAPGALIALRLFLHYHGVSVLLLSDREYYGPQHFPGLDVHVAPYDELAPETERLAPDAVLASAVSWRGEVGDVGALTRAVRARNSKNEMLLCVDWCQAGAAGFPPAGDIDADLILGDATKWLVPAGAPDRLAFLVGKGPKASSLGRCFTGLYLSGGCRTVREARWVDPETLAGVAGTLAKLAPDRTRLDRWHEENMRLARDLARQHGLGEPESALLWFPRRAPDELVLDGLPSSSLIWTMDSGVRVQCQVLP